MQAEAAKFLIHRLRRIADGGPLAYDAIAIGEAADMIEAMTLRYEKAGFATVTDTWGLEDIISSDLRGQMVMLVPFASREADHAG